MEATNLLPVELWFYISRNDFRICRELRKTFKVFNKFIKANRGILTKFFEKISTNTFGVTFSLIHENAFLIRENNLPVLIGAAALYWNQKSYRIKKPCELRSNGTLVYTKHLCEIYFIRVMGDYAYINRYEKMVVKYCDGVSSCGKNRESINILIDLLGISWVNKYDFSPLKTIRANGSILYAVDGRRHLPKKLCRKGRFK